MRERLSLQSRKRRNGVHAALLFGALIALSGTVGWFTFGFPGLIFLAALGLVMLVFGSGTKSRMIIRMYCGRTLRRDEAPDLFRYVDELSARAELPRPPAICYVPSGIVNAFSVGTRDRAVIALTGGLLELLDPRELGGVLAHEIAHIQGNDLRVMGLADFVSRTTVGLAWLGQILLLINLPLILAGAHSIPWILIAILISAPILSTLLQLALARTREFEADLEAAALTRDPGALASALQKMDRPQAGFLQRILLPGRHSSEPSLLRTHPPTDERVRRLLAIEREMAKEPPETMLSFQDLWDLHRSDADRRPPRWHRSGLWH